MASARTYDCWDAYERQLLAAVTIQKDGCESVVPKGANCQELTALAGL